MTAARMNRVKTAREMEMASTSGDSKTVSVSVKERTLL
jgi:hypothetical protein